MSWATVKEKVKKALEKDPDILTAKDKADETFGHNPAYLEDTHGITKSDLIRLSRLGLATKAKYLVEKTGEHRTRWIIFGECLNG